MHYRDLDNFSARAKNLGISEILLELLEKRGVSDHDIPVFLNPLKGELLPPENISHITEARDRIKLAIERKEKILVFGDYDCDGISGVSILMLALRTRTDASYFIPNRLTDGYGLSVETLKNIISHRRPNLVITVDCGITAVKEVEYLKSVGIDVIITDHHEPQNELPQCIVVDPKTSSGGYTHYCGAGVVLQLVRSLFGDEYRRYLDIAALATIADVVPLVGDNRIIAAQGLQLHNTSPRTGLKMLAGAKKLSSQDIMFKIAPRINAAGRLGSALKVVDLFLEDDYFLLKTLTEELEKDNSKRQVACEQVVIEAKEKLRGFDFSKIHIIILHGAKWEAGVLGIAAARLTEEFACPTILFAGEDEEYKGSARSIKSINIFELLSKYTDKFVSFGGHAQAAGLSINASDFDSFRDEITEDVSKSYPLEIFFPSQIADITLTLDDDFLTIAREMTLLEPTGYANPRPVFGLNEKGMNFKRISFTPHVKYERGDFELVGFNRYETLLHTGDSKISTRFSLDMATFHNRIYAQGILKEFSCSSVDISEKDTFLLNSHQLKLEGDFTPSVISIKDAESALDEPFGTLFVVFNSLEYKRFCEEVKGTEKLPICVGAQKWLNPQNLVVFAPNAGFDYRYFKRVIVAGQPLTSGYLAHINAQVQQIYSLYDEKPNLLPVSEDDVRSVYIAFSTIARNATRYFSPESIERDVRNNAKIDWYTYAVSEAILKELGLISVSDRGIITVSRVKTDLMESVIYRNVGRKE